MNEYAERVARGVLWLDHMHEGWREKVDASKLNMDSLYSCILGQVFDSYIHAVEVHLNGIHVHARDMGFDFTHGEVSDGNERDYVYASLENEWRKVLAA